MDPLEDQPLQQRLRGVLADPRHALVSADDPVRRVLAGVRRRRRNRALAAGSMVAVLIAGAAVGANALASSTQDGLQVATSPSATVSPTPEPTTSPTAASPDRSPTTTAPVAPPLSGVGVTPSPRTGASLTPTHGGRPVPAGFVSIDLSFVSTTRGWALGTAPCAKAPCTSLLRTADGGRTWSGGPAPIAYLPSDGADCAVVACISHLRFADATRGYAYGTGALFTTADAGETWTRQASPYVEQLEASGGDVLRVERTTDGCPPACSYSVERAAVGSNTWQRQPTPPIRGQNSLLLRHANDAYLLVYGNPAGGAGDAHATFAVSHDRGSSWALRPDPCSPASSNDPAERDAIDGSVGPDGSLAVLCANRQFGSSTGAVTVSTDRARSFDVVNPLPASSRPLSVATSGSRVLVSVVHDNNYDLLIIPQVGGYSAVASTPQPAASEFGTRGGLLGFTDANTGSWAMPGSRSPWRSTDGGSSWKPLPFLGG